MAYSNGKKRHPFLTVLAVILVLGALSSVFGNKKTDTASDKEDTSRSVQTVAEETKPASVNHTAPDDESDIEEPASHSAPALEEEETEEVTKEDMTRNERIERVVTLESVIQTDFDTTGYALADPVVVYDYGEYLSGEKIITVVTIADIDSSTMNANVVDTDSYIFNFTFYFRTNHPDYEAVLSDGRQVTIAGIVKDSSDSIFGISTGKNVSVEDCVIIGLGEIADAVTAAKDSNIAYCEAVKQAQEEAQAAALQAELENYMGQCTTVSYNDVERNPDNYKGQYIKVSGTVIQVSEGWFDSVTLRVDQGGGNIWYITYKHKEGESRILENDYITCYGTCEGVESYTTVLGSQVTLPAMKMEYFQ